MIIEIEYMEAGVPIPSYATEGSAGFDLVARKFLKYYSPYNIKSSTDQQECLDLEGYSSHCYIIEPNGRLLVGMRYKIAIPSGYEIQTRPRSGLALKWGLALANSVGTIDSDYRGEMLVTLINLSAFDIKVFIGDRIAQAIIARVERGEFIRKGKLPKTKRGEGGYGSTGKTARDLATEILNEEDFIPASGKPSEEVTLREYKDRQENKEEEE